MPKIEQLDAVVIGGNTRGLVTSYLLSTLGFKAVLLDRAPSVGGADASFKTSDGSFFEFGMHVLDEQRSAVATRLFTHIADNRVHRIKLKRAIVLRGHIMPYAPHPNEMPEELRCMLPSDPLVDDLGDKRPGRARLAKIYGQKFIDMIFDEVLPSYPTENRHRAFDVDESLLMTNIYPWFFPSARRDSKMDDESREFHDQLRNGSEQHILFPHEGGFGGFAKGFLQHLDTQRIEVLTGVDDVKVEVEPGTHTITSVSANGRIFKANHYFWTASWPQLCKLLDLPCQNIATDRVLLGSFRLNKPANSKYHEILVGDPECQCNRVYFPAGFRNSDEPLMQVEFMFPSAEDRPMDPDYWKDRWVEDLRRLGILDQDHRIEMFDFKTVPMHFNSFGMEGEPLIDADPSLIQNGSNIRPVAPSMANLNLNSHIPRTIDYVCSVLADVPITR